MDTKKIKLSDIIAAAKNEDIDLDIPATLFVVTNGETDDGCQLACSSIIPKNDAETAKRWVAQAVVAMLNGCFANNPRAWADLAYWKTVKLNDEEKAERAEEFKRIIAEFETERQKGEQE